ncbi:MAG TPA: CBS domain-containing protein [Candidatus Limnocylindrales bacterium]
MDDADEVTVDRLMTRDPVVIGERASLADVAELLEDYAISGLPVIDDRGTLVGVISRTDLVRVRAGLDPWSGWHGLLVADLMSQPVVTIKPSDTVSAAAETMTSRHVHRLVVVADDGSPLGVLSETDVVRDIAEGCDD